MAGMLAENVWKGVVQQMSWEEALRREDVLKLDVRGKALFEVGERREERGRRIRCPGL